MEWRPSFNLGNYLGSSSLLKGTSMIKPSLAPSAAVQPLRRYIPVQLSACMDLLATASASCSGRLQGAWAPCKPYFATPKLASLPSLPSIRLSRASLPSLPSLRLARRSDLASASSSSAPSSTPGSLGHSATGANTAPHTTLANSNSMTPPCAHAHPSRRRRVASSATLWSQRRGVALQTAALDCSAPPPHGPSTPAFATEAAAPAFADGVLCAEQGQQMPHIASSSSEAFQPQQSQQQQQQQLHAQQGQQAQCEEDQLRGPTSLPIQPTPTSPLLSPYSTIPLPLLQQPSAPCTAGSSAVGWTSADEAIAPSPETPAHSLASFYQSLEAALADMHASCAQLLNAEAGGKGGGEWLLGMWGAELQGQEHSPEVGAAAQRDSLQGATTFHPSGWGTAAAAASAGLATSAAASGGGFSSSSPSLSKPPPWRSPLRTYANHAARCPPPCALATATSAATTAAASSSTAGTAAAAAAGPVVSTQAVAVVLGYAVLVGSCFRSLPQILKVVRARSTEGLSLVSNIVELLCYTIIVAYNVNHGYAFNTYGEVLACWLQDIVLVGLIFRHTNTPLPFAAAAGGVFALLCSYLFQPGACPIHILGFLQLSSVFIMALGSRIPQIVLNVRRGNAGMMSLTTCMLNVAGNTTRIFTTLVLTKDMYILSACSTQFVLNSILLWQCFSTRKAAKQQRMRAEGAVVERAGEGSKHGIQEGLKGAEVNHSGEEGYNTGGGSGSAGGYPQPQPA